MKKTGHIFLFALLSLFLCMFFSFSVLADTAETNDGTVSVRASVKVSSKETKITVTVKADDAYLKLHEGERIFLFAVQQYESIEDFRSLTPIDTGETAGMTRFEIIMDEDNRELTAGFVIARSAGETYEAISDMVYIDNPEALAVNTAKRKEPVSVKGITASREYLGDLYALGVSQAVLPVSIDTFLTVTAQNVKDTDYSVTIDGQTLFFDKDAVLALDAEAESLRKAGIKLYFRFLLDGTAKGTTSPAASLYATGASADASGYGIYTGTVESWRIARSVFRFFAERYCTDESAYQTDFILGYQINEGTKWNNLGGLSGERYFDSYISAFRIMNTELHAVSENSYSYVSVSNLYTTVKTFLSYFAEEMKEESWALALACYGSDPTSDHIWDDESAVNDENTFYLTPENLTVLKKLLAQPEYLYCGKIRSVIIDDFAVQNIQDSVGSETRQAASIVYAYYQSVCSGFIDGFIYHRILDNANENASYGLKTADGSKKTAYTMFSVMDTENGEKTTKQLLTVTDVKRWSSLVKNYKTKLVEPIRLFEEDKKAIQDAENEFMTLDCFPLFDAGTNTLGILYPTENTGTMALSRVAGNSILSITTDNTETCNAGVTAYPTETVEIPKDARAVSVSLKANSILTNAATVTLYLSSESGDMRYCAGTSVISGSTDTIVFPIDSFVGKADGIRYIKLTIAGVSTVEVTELAILRGDTFASLFLQVVKLVILIVLLLVVVFFVLVIRNNRRKKRRKKMLLEKQKRQLAEMQRRNMQNPGGNTMASNPIRTRETDNRTVPEQEETQKHAQRRAKRNPDSF